MTQCWAISYHWLDKLALILALNVILLRLITFAKCYVLFTPKVGFTLCVLRLRTYDKTYM